MTVREAARLLGRSPSTIYRWLRKGQHNRFARAGLVVRKQGRRWILEEKTVTENQQWPAYVKRDYAEADGLTPEDLRFDQWPVSNVVIRHLEPGEGSVRHQAVLYECDLPADTPQTNVYVEDADAPDGWRKKPDPTSSMAMSSVRFELRDADTGEVLHTSNTASHFDGKASGHLGDTGDAIWGRLTPPPPGESVGAPVRVRLVAYPMFFYLNDEGGMVAYAIGNYGYFRGEEVESDVYTLSMIEGEVLGETILIDGEGRPQPAAPPVELPADWQEGQTFGQYVRMRREGKGLSQFDLGAQIGQPWKTQEGAETYDPDQWIEWIETDQAQLRLEWNGEVVLNSTQVYGLADALGVDGQRLTNLAEGLV